MSAKTIIIAEVGVNHSGDIAIAKDLICLAAQAGADIVKFQTFKADTLVSRGAAKAEYQLANSTKDESQQEMLKKLELSEEMHLELFEFCRHKNIEFMSTAFDINSLNFLIGLGQKQIKIPSGEITNLPYLRNLAKHKKPLILSTGMSTVEEIEAAIDALIMAGQPRDLITILHCTTEYPAPMAEVNLRAMNYLSAKFKMPVGYSDHTQGIEVAIAAVALGATVIEKHITMDRNLPGPDHKASLEPNELISMVKAIRNIEIALGKDEKKPTDSEFKNRVIARQSVIATKRITRGTLFSEQNIATKRPGNGLSPMRWDEIVGQVAIRDFDQDEQIEL
jgi:N,N'-diacetyllegionaminate synthase